jgi:hypothetical protein
VAHIFNNILIDIKSRQEDVGIVKKETKRKLMNSFSIGAIVGLVLSLVIYYYFLPQNYSGYVVFFINNYFFAVFPIVTALIMLASYGRFVIKNDLIGKCVYIVSSILFFGTILIFFFNQYSYNYPVLALVTVILVATVCSTLTYYLSKSLWVLGIAAAPLLIIIILGIFFGAFTSPVGDGTICVANAGFLCNSLTYFGGTGIGTGTGGGIGSATPAGNIMATLGQSTGSNMYNFALAFVPSGSSLTASGVPNVSFLSYPAIAGGTLYSGASATLMINATGAYTTPIGTTLSGNLWIAYTTTPGVAMTCASPASEVPVANCLYQSIATLTEKAT